MQTVMGLGGVKPEISVHVTPEFLALLSAGRGGSQTSAHPQDACVDTPYPDAVAPGQTLGWPKVRLRRDGMRPLICQALPVATGRDEVVVSVQRPGRLAEEYVVETEITLYRHEDGETIVQAVHTPPDTAPARPVYRVAQVADADDLRRFLDVSSAKSCFDVSAAGVIQHRPAVPRPFSQTPATACAEH